MEESEHPGAGREASLAERLKRKFGQGVDPRVSLDGGPDSSSGASTGGQSELVEALRSRGFAGRHYSLKSEVARGGMGAILKVWDDALRRHLAMKVILHKGKHASIEEIDPRILARFLEEAQVTGQLDHPGIVPVHDLSLDDRGALYFTMRLVKGRDLEDIFVLVDRGEEDWNETRALGVILKVCDAMAYAHDKGVLHRDLKPANIMVGSFGEVYVMDWGLARVIGQEDLHGERLGRNPDTDIDVFGEELDSGMLTMDGDIVGTPAYMSPEQAEGRIEDVDKRSDVYSVGAMLYRLLAGRVPYETDEGEPSGPVELIIAQREGPPAPLIELNPNVPAELEAICEKAMTRDSDGRYAEMLELASDLRAYLENRVVKAYEAGAIAEIKKWILRNKGFAAMSAAAIALLVVGLATSSTLFVKAQNARVKVLRLSDVKRLENMTVEAASMWPAYPEHEQAYREWLDRADKLTARLDEHRAALTERRAAALPLTPEEALQQEESMDDERPWHFARPEDQWQHDVLVELVKDMESFVDPEKGLVEDVKRRLTFATQVEERTLTGPDATRRWQAAIASISNPTECPAYAGLTIQPQLGLLPIGRDETSGLWEFLHVQSGAEPARNLQGSLIIDGEVGIILVLLPGGPFWMGAQKADPTEPRYDPNAQNNEAPPHIVELDPFFISKYEMTQGQWLRFAGYNPSNYGPKTELGEFSFDLSHPVERVSWKDCAEVTEHLGLILPTEAQWEHAARAGTDSPWWTGAEKESLIGAANLADQTAKKSGATYAAIRDWPELDDGFPAHAPAGTFLPNAFGLHEVHGNVAEWCLDWFALYAALAEEGTGLRSVNKAKYRIYRGGTFDGTAAKVRVSHRGGNDPLFEIHTVGLRPARRLER